MMIYGLYHLSNWESVRMNASLPLLDSWLHTIFCAKERESCKFVQMWKAATRYIQLPAEDIWGLLLNAFIHWSFQIHARNWMLLQLLVGKSKGEPEFISSLAGLLRPSLLSSLYSHTNVNAKSLSTHSFQLPHLRHGWKTKATPQETAQQNPLTFLALKTLLVTIGIELNLRNHRIVRDHHGHRPEEGLSAVGKKQGKKKKRSTWTKHT